MKFVRTELPDVIVIEPDVYQDPRGCFLETYHERKYREGGIPGPFVQDNQSRSVRGTLRGLHAQRCHPQGKLVRVLRGAIFDVAVDVRRGSPTFGRWVGVSLTGENFRQCYIPPGFVHGFCVTSDFAEVEYKVTDFYDPGGEMGVAWNDPDIGVAWPLSEPLLSEKDRAWPRLRDCLDILPAYAEPAIDAPRLTQP
jgi:dTDP-4-dehydrorhamnose 3,5-epimerase